MAIETLGSASTGQEKGNKEVINKYKSPSVPFSTVPREFLSAKGRADRVQDALEAEGEKIPAKVMEALKGETFEQADEDQVSFRRIIPDKLFKDEKLESEYTRMVDALNSGQKTFSQLLEDAGNSAKSGNRKKLTALKMLGARLLQKSGAERGWEGLDDDDKDMARLAETLIANTEAKAVLTMKERGDEIKRGKSRELKKHLNKFSKNADVPDSWKGDINKAAAALGELEKKKTHNVDGAGDTGDKKSVLGNPATNNPPDNMGDTKISNRSLDDTVIGSGDGGKEAIGGGDDELIIPNEPQKVSSPPSGDEASLANSDFDLISPQSDPELLEANNRCGQIEQRIEELASEKASLLKEKEGLYQWWVALGAQLSWLNGRIGPSQRLVSVVGLPSGLSEKMPEGFLSKFDGDERLEELEGYRGRVAKKGLDEQAQRYVDDVIEYQEKLVEEFEEYSDEREISVNQGFFSDDKDERRALRGVLNKELEASMEYARTLCDKESQLANREKLEQELKEAQAKYVEVLQRVVSNEEREEKKSDLESKIADICHSDFITYDQLSSLNQEYLTERIKWLEGKPATAGFVEARNKRDLDAKVDILSNEVVSVLLGEYPMSKVVDRADRQAARENLSDQQEDRDAMLRNLSRDLGIAIGIAEDDRGFLSLNSINYQFRSLLWGEEELLRDWQNAANTLRAMAVDLKEEPNYGVAVTYLNDAARYLELAVLKKRLEASSS